jgi:2-polyprenyl-6-methoxyphenol hydroxylase-like FAD-dependent oxidoreductase
MSRHSDASAGRPHVLVVGGGIGGLCLAQALKGAGLRVAVFERDRTPTAREQGYRVHVDPTGSRALHECLPPVLWDVFVATAGDPGTTGFGFLTERLQTLVLVEDEIFGGGATGPSRGHHAVSRITLRQILTAGLDDVVHYDKEFVRYEQRPDGRVTASFADSTSATGDLLVGADGAGSRVRAQRLPGVARVDTGAVGIGGKLDLDERTRAWLPERIQSGMNVVLGPRDFLFTAVFKRRRGTDEVRRLLGAAVRAAGLDEDRLFGSLEQRDSILWAFITRGDACPPDCAGAAAQRLVGGLIQRWHPDLRRLVADSAPDTVRAFPFRTSVPVRPWPSTNVTLLGDAIHSMTPAGGVGANTALRDAAVLGRVLVEVDRGARSLLPAVAGYEAQMLDYGFAAVRKSLARTRQAVEPPLFRVGTRAFLRLCGALPALRRAVFQDSWTDRPAARGGGAPVESVATGHWPGGGLLARSLNRSGHPPSAPFLKGGTPNDGGSGAAAAGAGSRPTVWRGR